MNTMSMSERIRQKQESIRVAKINSEKSLKETTLAKYELTELRISEIEEKMRRLQEEKENLIRKQSNRRKLLEGK